MSNFIVEHRRDGNYVMETLMGVEDIDTSIYQSLIGIWVCETAEETHAMEKELRKMRHAKRSSQSS